MVTQKYERQEELLSSMIKQRQATVNDHISGRKLMDDEVCSIFDICLGVLLQFIHIYICMWTFQSSSFYGLSLVMHISHRSSLQYYL